MGEAQLYQISNDVMVREVDDGAVLLELEKGVYYGLDPIGLRIWHMISEQRSIGTICEQLNLEYDVSQNKLSSDVINLLGELEQNGLVRQLNGND